MLQCWWRTGYLPSFFVPSPGNLTAQKSPPLGICHPRQKKMLISGPFPIILFLILCKVKVKHHSLVESFSLPFCLVLCTIFIYNDVCFSIIIPPWSLEWCQAKYKRIPYLPFSKSSWFLLSNSLLFRDPRVPFTLIRTGASVPARSLFAVLTWTS